MRVDIRNGSEVNDDLRFYVMPLLNGIVVADCVAFDTCEKWLVRQTYDPQSALHFRDEHVQLSNGSTLGVVVDGEAPGWAKRKIAALLESDRRKGWVTK